jgi:hypothetical protein
MSDYEDRSVMVFGGGKSSRCDGGAEHEVAMACDSQYRLLKAEGSKCSFKLSFGNK